MSDLRGGHRISTRHRKGPSSEAKDYSLPDDCDVTLSREKSMQKILSTAFCIITGATLISARLEHAQKQSTPSTRIANLLMQGGEIRGRGPDSERSYPSSTSANPTWDLHSSSDKHWSFVGDGGGELSGRARSVIRRAGRKKMTGYYLEITRRSSHCVQS